jgi:hypothetical protein
MKNYLINYKQYLKRWSVWATTALLLLSSVTPWIVEQHPEYVAIWSGFILALGVIRQGEDGPLGRWGARIKGLLVGESRAEKNERIVRELAAKYEGFHKPSDRTPAQEVDTNLDDPGGEKLKRIAKVLPFTIMLLLIGCRQKPPQYTAEESLCIAIAEANYQHKRMNCGSNVAGDCSTDALIDRQKEEVSECFPR